MRCKRTCLGILLCLALLTTVSLAQDPQAVWQQYRTPEEAGWSSEKLAGAKASYDSVDAAAFLVIHDGKVLISWGDVTRRYMCHSVRKSFLSALYGTHVDDGSVDIDRTLADLGIDDRLPLSEGEKQASVQDLLKARSGVYHPAAYETQQMKRSRPERGSHEHDTFWYYNNWDFNTLCTILEQETGTDVFVDFKQRIADPIGMEDFRLIDGYHHYEDESLHPAYPFKMSARDMARFGWLFLRGGRWNDEQVISEEWVEESTASYSDVSETVGYGYMWWIRNLPDIGKAYYASGYGGHRIGVLPGEGIVFVQRVDTYVGKSVSGRKTMDLVGLILDARTGEANPDPDLVTFEPPGRDHDPMSTPPADLADYVRQYPSAAGELEIAEYDGGLLLRSSVFGNYRLYPLSNTKFFIEDMEGFLVVELGDGEPSQVTIHQTEAVADLYDTITRDGIEVAAEQYRRVEDSDPDDRVFSEASLNGLGYQLLAVDRVAEAIGVFKLNVDAYPESYNVYDSLGEAYMTGEDYDLAIQNYQRSLELNPDNVNAEQKITCQSPCRCAAIDGVVPIG
jgi:CubicO group peptidase (beta-lactamase class C family)